MNTNPVWLCWVEISDQQWRFYSFLLTGMSNGQTVWLAPPYNAMGNYRIVSYIRHTLVDNKIVDHSDVVGASPVGAAPTTS